MSLVIKVWLRLEGDTVVCICPYNKKEHCTQSHLCSAYVAKLTSIDDFLVQDSMVALDRSIGKAINSLNKLNKSLLR